MVNWKIVWHWLTMSVHCRDFVAYLFCVITWWGVISIKRVTDKLIWLCMNSDIWTILVFSVKILVRQTHNYWFFFPPDKQFTYLHVNHYRNSISLWKSICKDVYTKRVYTKYSAWQISLHILWQIVSFWCPSRRHHKGRQLN